MCTNNTDIDNHSIHIRFEDQLILNAIIGSLLPLVIPFITTSKTSHDARNTLAATYSKPSREHILQIKGHLKNPIKGTQSVTEFIQFIKSRADELAFLDASMHLEDLTSKILDGLDVEYKDLVSTVQTHDNLISFKELHEKFIMYEVSL